MSLAKKMKMILCKLLENNHFEKKRWKLIKLLKEKFDRTRPHNERRKAILLSHEDINNFQSSINLPSIHSHSISHADEEQNHNIFSITAIDQLNQDLSTSGEPHSLSIDRARNKIENNYGLRDILHQSKMKASESFNSKNDTIISKLTQKLNKKATLKQKSLHSILYSLKARSILPSLESIKLIEERKQVHKQRIEQAKRCIVSKQEELEEQGYQAYLKDLENCNKKTKSQSVSLCTPKIIQSQSPVRRPESPTIHEIRQELNKIQQRFVESLERTNKVDVDKINRIEQK